LLALRQRLPCAQLTGLDLSGEMLAKARKRLQDQVQVRLCDQLYDAPLASRQGFDLVLFSYTLSMINPGWDHVLRCAQQDLSPGGRLAVVDFAASPVPWFKRWMQLNHVRMEAHLAPELQLRFHTEQLEMRRAYGGLWQYLLFIGQRNSGS
ncbi:MAG: class I SAM-dependent methyltransferase, partial [Candidatus Competibacteraceae bacterium]|nr:class I SAM-dependent methyltransferase [Candidatus Competibacteraceae bacterium]